MLKRKFAGMDDDDEEESKEECSELFESKFVKQIIEAFNTVLEVVEQQESELNDWVGEDLTNLVPKPQKKKDKASNKVNK